MALRLRSFSFELAVAVLLVVASGVAGVVQGKDANIDLYRYRLYIGYAFLHDRLDTDLVPASLGTFLNPVLDTAHYLGIRHLPPRTFGFLLGAFQGLNAVLVFLIARHLFAGSGWRLPAALAGLLAATGPTARSLLGTTLGDTTVSVPALLALLLLLRGQANKARGRAAAYLMGAGLLGGAALGLKLTMAPALVGLGTLVLLGAASRRTSLGAASAWLAGSVLGYLGVAGYWCWQLWERFGNPLFPFANQLFRSPYLLAEAVRDSRWMAHGITDYFHPPIDIAFGITERLQEIPLRDLRWLLALLVTCAWLGLRLARRRQPLPPAERWLLVYFLVGYVAWGWAFYYYRYAAVLEFLVPLVLLIAIRAALPKLARPAMITATLGILLTASVGSWGRLAWGERWFDVRLPPQAQERRSLVLVDSSLSSFLIPYFPKTTSFAGLEGTGSNRFEALLAARIDTHEGNLFWLVSRGQPAPSASPDRFGLVVTDDCGVIRTGEGRWALCRLARPAGPQRSSVVLPHRASPPAATTAPAPGERKHALDAIPGMTARYAGMFAFGLFLLGSWAGWGAAIRRLLAPQAQAERALEAGWGLALSLLAGGLLNLSGRITPLSIRLFVAVGFALLLWDCHRDRRRLQARLRLTIRRLRREPTWATATAVLVGALAIGYAASICSTVFNAHDDLQAYFVYPAKMVETGALGPDPYSERRILSLGSMSFLHALVLNVADHRFLRIVDPGLGLVLCAALLARMARVARAHKWASWLIVLLFLLTPPPAVNVTSLVTGLALFLTLFLTLYRPPLRTRNGMRTAIVGAVPVALTASGLCGLKTNHLVATGLLIAAAYLVKGLSQRDWSGAIKEATVAAGLTLLFLAPWMIALYQSNGTAFYPVLGLGFHGSANGTYWSPGDSLTLRSAAALLRQTLLDLRIVPLIILGAGVLLRVDLGARRFFLFGWAVAAMLSLVPIPLILAGAVEAYRYSYPFVYAVVFLLMMFAFPARMSSSLPWRDRGRGWLAGALAFGALAFAHAPTLGTYVSRQLSAISAGITDSRHPGFMLRVERAYASMQQALPQGATVLTRLQYPFLLDFARNQVLIVDYPGGSSPPPGMPFFQGGGRLADYLCRQPIRYLAYSYRNEAGFYDAMFQERLAPGREPWLRLQALHTQDFQRSLAELGQTRMSLFDDGDVFVLDLTRSVDGQPLSCAPW